MYTARVMITKTTAFLAIFFLDDNHYYCKISIKKYAADTGKAHTYLINGIHRLSYHQHPGTKIKVRVHTEDV
jgi:hypothetical protein